MIGPLILGAAAFLACLAALIAMRVGYPFPLEVAEEGVAMGSVRALAGQALYGPPNADFVPFLYGPVYFLAGAGAFSMFGEQLWALRLISICATAYVIFAMHRIASGVAGPRAGWLAAGFFAATYHLGGAWFDLARVDMLHLAFLFASLRAAQRERTVRSAVWALLAIFTKQSALGIVLGMAIGLAFHRSRKAVELVLCLTIGIVLVIAVGDLLTHRWFAYFLVVLPGEHAMLWNLWYEVFVEKLLRDFAGFLVLAGVAIGFLLRGRDWREQMPLVGFVSSAIAVGCLARLRDGGWYNVMIPGHAGLALLAAVGVVWIVTRLESKRVPVLPLAGFCLAAWQLGWCAYDPREHVPTAEQRENGVRVENVMKQTEGGICSPTLSFTAHRAGKPAQPDGTALWDIQRAKNKELVREPLDQFITRLLDGTYRAVLVNTPANRDLKSVLSVVLPAFPEGQHMHVASPRGDRTTGKRATSGYEKLWWYLRTDDTEMAERVRNSVLR